MLSRNQIRQTALQYLYAASQTPETEQEGIWDILMEPFRGDYCKLKAKAVSGHLTRDYPDKLRLFITARGKRRTNCSKIPLPCLSATSFRISWPRKENSTPPCSG